MRLLLCSCEALRACRSVFCTKGTLTYSREIFAVYALPTASVPNKTYVQLGVSLARNSRMTPLQSKGRTYRRAKPIFVSTLLITLKGILPLTALAEPAVAAGLCPTPQQGASPLHPFLRSPLGKRSGVHPDRSALASLDRDASRSSRFRGRLRRTLTLHLSFSGKDRSSHDAAERGARGTAGGSAPEDKERAGRSPLPLVASPAP